MRAETPTVADLVRRAVEICDPDDTDPALGRLEQQFEDDDTPITAVENLEERLAWAAEGVDAGITRPAVSVAIAVTLALAERPSRMETRDPSELITLAARAQWHGRPPGDVADWLADRGADV